MAELGLRLRCRFVSICGIGLFCAAAFAGGPQRIQSSDGQPDDDFGYGLASAADRLLIGARLADDPGTGSGAAYVFERSPADGSWEEITKISSPTGSAWDLFGRSLSLHGNSVLIGSPGDDEADWNSGAVYVYEENGGEWEQQQKLIPNDPQNNPGFALELAGEGNFAVAGARRDSTLGFYVGSAYVLERDQQSGLWAQAAKLDPSDARPSGQFGYAVAISQERVVVGAPFHSALAGRAYVYRLERDGSWIEEQILNPAGVRPGTSFGASVAIHGQEIAVSTNEPAIYLFQLRGRAWKMKQVLRLTGAGPGQRAIAALDFGETRLVVGDPDANGFSGAVHVYGRAAVDTPWHFLELLEGVEPLGAFGAAVLGTDQELFVTELDGDGVSSASGVVWSYSQ